MHVWWSFAFSMQIDGGRTVMTWKLNGPTTVHFLSEPMHVWTSRALESNNCSPDVSKHGVHLALCHAESSHLMVKGRFKTCSGLWRPWDFLHHELIVCFIPHFFWFPSQPTAVKQAGHLSKSLFPGEKICHLCMCHFCLAALSHLLAHFA